MQRLMSGTVWIFLCLIANFKMVSVNWRQRGPGMTIGMTYDRFRPAEVHPVPFHRNMTQTHFVDTEVACEGLPIPI